jgi:hypothetical protein
MHWLPACEQLAWRDFTSVVHQARAHQKVHQKESCSALIVGSQTSQTESDYLLCGVLGVQHAATLGGPSGQLPAAVRFSTLSYQRPPGWTE